MTLPVVVISRTRGRTPTRGKSYARPLSSGMEISRFHQGAWRGVSFQRDLISRASLVMRAVSADLNHIAVGLYPGTCFSCDDTESVRFKFSPAIQVAGHLSSLVKFFQKPTSGLTNSFQVLSLLPAHVFKHGRRTRQDAVTARQERGYE